MSDPALPGLLHSAADGDLDAVLILADLLEERQDERAGPLRRLHVKLYDDLLFAPTAFKHHQVAKKALAELFPEHPWDDEGAP
jgi:hypothetical protein